MKWLVISLVMLLGLYPIVELTRVILIYAVQTGDAGFINGATWEIGIMWMLYMLIPPVLIMGIKD